MKILITGANGYIGRHMTLILKDHNITCIGLDNLSNSKNPQTFFPPLKVPFYEGDIADTSLLHEIFTAHPDIDAVIHFAGLIYVGESFERPAAYYQANTLSAAIFFNFVFEKGVRNIVLSSSAGVYGTADKLPISEDQPQHPINPYGRSKLAMEWILSDIAAQYIDMNIILLRYFNVAGADNQGRSGQNSPSAHHLIEVACNTALGLRDSMKIFGTDYDTPDGTCIRDYIHVNDLVSAHLDALRYNRQANRGHVIALNCGYGRGYSNKEIIETVKDISGHDFDVEDAPRRAGDPPALIACNQKIQEILKWSPHHDNIRALIQSAYDWQKKLMS